MYAIDPLLLAIMLADRRGRPAACRGALARCYPHEQRAPTSPAESAADCVAPSLHNRPANGWVSQPALAGGRWGARRVRAGMSCGRR